MSSSRCLLLEIVLHFWQSFWVTFTLSCEEHSSWLVQEQEQLDLNKAGLHRYSPTVVIYYYSDHYLSKSGQFRQECCLSGMGGEAFFFTGRGGAGRGKAKNLRDGALREPPLPHNAGRGGEGVKICGVGRGRGGEHAACISWLKSYAAAKEILICIASCEVNLLNIHNLDRNHN